MPLGKSVSKNIEQMYKENKTKDKKHKRSRDQMIAIAYSAAKEAKKK